MSKFRNWPHKYMIFSDHFHLDSFCDCFLCLDVRVWGGFSEPSLLGMDCPTMLTVGRRAEASSDCCSCSSPIVAALYPMSWAMELQKRIVSIASKVKHLWVCSLDPSTVASDSSKVRHKSVLLLYQLAATNMVIKFKWKRQQNNSDVDRNAYNWLSWHFKQNKNALQ